LTPAARIDIITNADYGGHSGGYVDSKDRVQLVWGLALVVMGMAFLFHAQSVIDRIFVSADAGSFHFFIRTCMFFMSIILIGGGLKKLIHIRRILINRSTPENHRDNREDTG